MGKTLNSFVKKITFPLVISLGATFLNPGCVSLRNPYMPKSEKDHKRMIESRDGFQYKTPYEKSLYFRFKNSEQGLRNDSAVAYTLMYHNLRNLADISGPDSKQEKNYNKIQNLNINSQEGLKKADSLFEDFFSGLDTDLEPGNSHIEDIKERWVPWFKYKCGCYHLGGDPEHDDIFNLATQLGPAHEIDFINNGKTSFTWKLPQGPLHVVAEEGSDSYFRISYDDVNLAYVSKSDETQIVNAILSIQSPDAPKTIAEAREDLMKNYSVVLVGGRDTLGVKNLITLIPLKTNDSLDYFNTFFAGAHTFFIKKSLGIKENTFRARLEILVNEYGNKDTLYYARDTLSVDFLSENEWFYSSLPSMPFHNISPDSTGIKKYEISMAVSSMDGERESFSRSIVELPKGTDRILTLPAYKILKSGNKNVIFPDYNVNQGDSVDFLTFVSGLNKNPETGSYEGRIQLSLNLQRKVDGAGRVIMPDSLWFQWENQDDDLSSPMRNLAKNRNRISDSENPEKDVHFFKEYLLKRFDAGAEKVLFSFQVPENLQSGVYNVNIAVASTNPKTGEEKIVSKAYSQLLVGKKENTF